MKKYIAKTNVSINVVLASGKSRHVSFDSVTGGGSVFYTDDPALQQALERHYKYGKLFKGVATNSPSPALPDGEGSSDEVQNTGDSPSLHSGHDAQSEADDQSGHDEDDADDEVELKTVVVTDPDEAKAYLADNFGLSRTKLKSIKAIKAAAEENGIVFEGI